MFSLQDALSLPDPAYSFLWGVQNASFPALVSQGMPNYDYKRYIHAVGLTHPSFQAAPAFRHSKNRYYIGSSDINSLTITFYEDRNYSTHKWIAWWRAAFRNKRYQYSLPKDYKGMIEVALLSGVTDEQSFWENEYAGEPGVIGSGSGELSESGVDSIGLSSVSLTARLVGLFPTTPSPTDLDFNNNQRIIVPIEFQVDDVQYFADGVKIEA